MFGQESYCKGLKASNWSSQPPTQRHSMLKSSSLMKQYQKHLLIFSLRPNPSIERTSLSQLRWPKAAAHVER
jgi:hypothetical protein